MRLVFAGTPEVALPSLRAVAASRHDVVAVLTRPDTQAGRGRVRTRSPVADWADEQGLPVLAPRRLGEPDVLDRLQALAPDCCPVVAYGGLVPPAALAVPAHGWVNLHFSLLPAWRGAAPVQRALMAGETITGATTFLLDPGLDTGPLLGVLTEAVRPRDTAGGLLDRLAQAGAGLLVSTLDGIEDGVLAPRPQASDGVSLAPKLTADDARVAWSLPAHIVDRVVRGCTPAPGAWTTLRGERVRLGPVTPLEASQATHQDREGRPLAPGTLDVGRRAVLVGTGSGPVVLGEVQGEGRRSMPAADWARGLRLGPGEFFT